MNKLRNYLNNISMRRVIVMLLGVVLTGWGIATFRLAALGTDPYSGMNLALADFLGIPYPTLQILVNVGFFIIQLLWGRSLLGPGTIANAFGLAYVVSFFYAIYIKYLPAPEGLPLRLLILLIGLAICSLGLSMYQQADLGVAPYDALPLILTKRVRNTPFFLWRVLADAGCALVCFLTGGVLGIGTLATAFGLGPVIQLFDHSLTAIFLGNRPGRQTSGK